MKFNKIYIISWFGNGNNLEKRIRYHDNQLDWCHKNKLEPVIFAQNYKDEYYRSNVTYIKYNGQVLRFGEARDQLLKIFYQTDDDFAIFADNDAFLYEGSKYGDNDRFVQMMQEMDINQFDHVDCFYPINPAFVPFTKDLKKHKISDQTSWRMRPGYVAAQFFVLKNLKKFYNKEFYYDSNFVLPDRSILPAEDQEFAVNLIHNGYTSFACPNLIKKDQGLHNSDSTWSNHDREVWRQKCIQGLTYIAKKYDLPIPNHNSSNQQWIKKMMVRNNKFRHTKVYFKLNTFNNLFTIE